MNTKKLFDPKDHHIKITTPVGRAMWASLKDPRSWKDDDKANFLCELILTEEEGQPIIDQCVGVQEKILDLCSDDEKNMQLSAHNPWRTPAEDDRVPEGMVQFKFKKRAFPAGKLPATPPIPTYIDGKKIDWSTTDYNVGNMSQVIVGAHITPYYVPMLGLGITLRLDAVKVLDLNKYVAGGASDDFDSEFADSTQTTVSAYQGPDTTEADEDPF